MRKNKELSEPNSCLNKANPDELIFVLLERDAAAANVVEFWMAERVRLGKNKPGDKQISEAADWVRAVRNDTTSAKPNKYFDEKHAANPEVGDYWHECLCGIVVVVARLANTVIYCKTKKDVGDDSWTWDLEKLEVCPVDEFYKVVSYSSGRPDHFFCSVMPRAHGWVADALKEMDKEFEERDAS